MSRIDLQNIHDAAAFLGRLGGQAGRGASKCRGDSAYYGRLKLLSDESKRAKKAVTDRERQSQTGIQARKCQRSE